MGYPWRDELHRAPAALLKEVRLTYQYCRDWSGSLHPDEWDDFIEAVDSEEKRVIRLLRMQLYPKPRTTALIDISRNEAQRVLKRIRRGNLEIYVHSGGDEQDYVAKSTLLHLLKLLAGEEDPSP